MSLRRRGREVLEQQAVPVDWVGFCPHNRGRAVLMPALVA